MRKYFQFKKEKKAMLATGILIITVILIAELLKQEFVRAETYVPLKGEQQNVNTIAVKKETFTIEQNTELSQKTETYINADSDVLKEVKLGLSVVNVTASGTYQAVTSLQKECVSFVVKAVENAKPVIQTVYMDFQFIIESNFIMQEVRDYAGVTAVDASGNDLSILTTGWDEELPVEAKTVTYQLNVESAQGQRVKKSVHVQYPLPEEDKKD